MIKFNVDKWNFKVILNSSRYHILLNEIFPIRMTSGYPKSHCQAVHLDSACAGDLAKIT